MHLMIKAKQRQIQKQRHGYKKYLCTDNTYSILSELDNSNDTTVTTEIPKPPPIYIQAQIIEPLIELLEQQVGNNNYTLKQLKENRVKIQLKTSEYYSSTIDALKNKNALNQTVVIE